MYRLCGAFSFTDLRTNKIQLGLLLEYSRAEDKNDGRMNWVCVLDRLSSGKITLSFSVAEFDSSREQSPIHRSGYGSRVCKGGEYILHPAARTSVPRSVKDQLNQTESTLIGH